MNAAFGTAAAAAAAAAEKRLKVERRRDESDERGNKQHVTSEIGLCCTLLKSINCHSAVSAACCCSCMLSQLLVDTRTARRVFNKTRLDPRKRRHSR